MAETPRPAPAFSNSSAASIFGRPSWGDRHSRGTTGIRNHLAIRISAQPISHLRSHPPDDDPRLDRDSRPRRVPHRFHTRPPSSPGAATVQTAVDARRLRAFAIRELEDAAHSGTRCAQADIITAAENATRPKKKGTPKSPLICWP